MGAAARMEYDVAALRKLRGENRSADCCPRAVPQTGKDRALHRAEIEVAPILGAGEIRRHRPLEGIQISRIVKALEDAAIRQARLEDRTPFMPSQGVNKIKDGGLTAGR